MLPERVPTPKPGEREAAAGRVDAGAGSVVEND
jgi:hypothetical protein